ncbi:RHS repeat-associated core domain-containing protein [Chryseobacterium kwangjuense]|uniref:RHS repeat-associated core domain-containing protein n=1 Tax=Chryseobacterium kwangjuense TaxID=267125 RepID=A0ABW9K736_9FLAO
MYNYTDHLGNTRLSYFKNGAGAEIIEESNYYPFGLKHEGYNVLTGNPAYKYKYKYNGKELQESGMYDYGARFYMADIGKWGVVDPLAELYRRWSPYNYVMNNPLRFIDPDGRQVEYAEDPNKSKKENRELRREFKRHQRELNRQSEEARNNWNTLVKSKNVHTIHLNEIDNNSGKNKENLTVSKSGYTPETGGGTDIYLDLTKTTAQGIDIGTPVIGIGHEEGHAFRFDTGQVEDDYQGSIMESNYMDNATMHNIRVKQTEEKEASHIENIIRAQIDPSGTKIPIRKTFENVDSFYIEPFTKKLKLNQTTINVIKPGYDYYKKKK